MNFDFFSFIIGIILTCLVIVIIRKQKNKRREVWINRKKRTRYFFIGYALNCTNAQDGQQMVLYKSEDDPNLTFVRERGEFYDKFFNSLERS